MTTARSDSSEGLDQDHVIIQPASVARATREGNIRQVRRQVLRNLREQPAAIEPTLEAARAVPTGRRRGPRQARSGQAEAVFYLRVSTKEQAEMGGEIEGYSIPAQREAAKSKAAELGALVFG